MLVVAGIILIGMWLERFLLVAPSLWKGQDLPLGLSEFLISLGFLGLMALSLLWFFKGFPLLPVSDPLFQETLEEDGDKMAGAEQMAEDRRNASSGRAGWAAWFCGRFCWWG